MTVHPAISVRHLTFAYGGTAAVSDMTFTVAPGEILGFLGPNGAGKSTTLKVLTGQLDAGAGQVEVLGMPMPQRREAVQTRLGVCFEEKNLYTSMSAAENLRFFARLFGLRRFDPAPLLDRVGLLERADDRVGEYSKGMRQRLMMARALVNGPDVLLLDEPTDGLDPLSARMIRRLIREEAERGAAVLLTTHDMQEADQLSDRVAFINDGRLLTIDNPEALKIRHGERSVLIRRRSGGDIVEQRLPLATSESEAMVKTAVIDPDVLTIHTEEATLEDIFIHYAGRGLTE